MKAGGFNGSLAIMAMNALEPLRAERERALLRLKKRRDRRARRALSDVATDRSATPPLSRSGPDGEAAKQAKDPSGAREPSPHDRNELRGVLKVIAVLVFTIIASLLVKKGQSLYVVGYIVAIVYVMPGPRRMNRSWSEIGLKPRAVFLKDLRKVWYLVAIVVLLFQLLPPEFGVAHVFGFYHQLLQHITLRTSKIPGLVGAAVILTLFETIVYQVCVQERLSWFIGTPAAILVAAVLAGFAHAAGASGSFQSFSPTPRESRSTSSSSGSSGPEPAISA
jgi:membrane protease YdiL (CAAX protease family)